MPVLEGIPGVCFFIVLQTKLAGFIHLVLGQQLLAWGNNLCNQLIGHLYRNTHRRRSETAALHSRTVEGASSYGEVQDNRRPASRLKSHASVPESASYFLQNGQELTSLYVVLPLLSTFSQTAMGKHTAHQLTTDRL